MYLGGHLFRQLKQILNCGVESARLAHCIRPAIGRFVETNLLQLQVVAVNVAVSGIKNLKSGLCQIFCRWHTIKQYRLVAGQGDKEINNRLVAAERQKSVIPGIDQMRLGNFLDLRKIHHHAVGGIAGLVDDVAGKGDFDGVAVPVQVPALALVVRDAVAGIEFKAAGDKHWKRPCGNGSADYIIAAMLTIEDHRRDSAGMTYVYPVVSRRAGGVSIGINLNVNNACNWACVYCQVEGLSRGGPPSLDLALLRRELQDFLAAALDGDFMVRQVPVDARCLVDVAFSGNGEPTSAAEFPEAIALVRDVLAERGLLPRLTMRLITNGSLIHRPAVKRGLRLLGEAGGEVWFKLDRAGELASRRVNGVAQSPAKVLKNLRTAIALVPTWLQTCWFAWDGMAPSADERAAYCELLLSLGDGLAGVHLYGLARPSLQPQADRLLRLPASELQDFAAEVEKKTGVRVVVNP